MGERVAYHHIVDGEVKMQQVELQSVVSDRETFAGRRVDQRFPCLAHPLRDLERQAPPDDRKEEEEEEAAGPTHPSL